jgi:hypothetical protein
LHSVRTPYSSSLLTLPEEPVPEVGAGLGFVPTGGADWVGAGAGADGAGEGTAEGADVGAALLEALGEADASSLEESSLVSAQIATPATRITTTTAAMMPMISPVFDFCSGCPPYGAPGNWPCG